MTPGDKIVFWDGKRFTTVRLPWRYRMNTNGVLPEWLLALLLWDGSDDPPPKPPGEKYLQQGCCETIPRRPWWWGRWRRRAIEAETLIEKRRAADARDRQFKDELELYEKIVHEKRRNWRELGQKLVLRDRHEYATLEDVHKLGRRIAQIDDAAKIAARESVRQQVESVAKRIEELDKALRRRRRR